MQSDISEPFAYTVLDACRISAMGKTQLYKHIRSGRIEARRLGCRTLIVGESLRVFLRTLPPLAAEHRRHQSSHSVN